MAEIVIQHDTQPEIVVEHHDRSVVVQQADQPRDIVIGAPATIATDPTICVNVGGGDAEVFRDKTGFTLNLRTISGLNGIAVAENGDVIEVDGAAVVGTPGGSDRQVQFNDGGTAFGGSDVYWTAGGLLAFGGQTATEPALKRNATAIEVRLADDSALTGITALDFALGGGDSLATHATRHENGGADEISVAGLSGALADPQTPSAHAATHQNGGADEISVTGLSGLLADPQTPAAHATTHQNGGADEISVAGLSGLLADAQDPTTHGSTHEGGGGDEIDVTGLSGLLADPQTPASHAATHNIGGADALSNFFYLPGVAGGQTAIGGTLTTQVLTLQDNAADANQVTFGPGLLNGLLDGQTGAHDSQWRHVGLGTFAAGNGHMLLGQEIFSGTGNKVGIGMFPALNSAGGAANLYGVQGNVFFGGNTWGAVSNINALQFYPAPDYQYGSTSWGNTNVNLLGITTGGMINIFTRTVSCNDLIGLTVQSLAHIFGGPGAVSANRAAAILVATPSQTTGTIATQSGIQIDPQLYGTSNQGVWFNGNAIGSDIVFGTGKNARIFYNGSNLVVDPQVAGSGRILIGSTGQRNMLLNDIEIDGALDHDGTTVGFYGTTPIVKQTGVAVTAAGIHAALVNLGLIT